jgi:glycosyltransferase involved in cell wall biosynthesis
MKGEPMKVQLIRSAAEKEDNQSGIGYYADYIEALLRDSNIEYETIHFEVNRTKGMKSLFLDNMVYPFLRVCRASKKVDIVHATAEHCSVFFPFTRSRKVLTFHHVVKPTETHRTWDLIWHFSVFIAKHFADEFIAISNQTKEDMIKSLKIQSEKITVITHPPKLSMYKSDVVKEDLVLFIGTLCERKRPGLAIDVFRHMLENDELKNYRMIICGDGPIRQDVEEYIRKYGLEESVDMISNISEEEICHLYNRSKILLNTSSLEGLGITTLESQKCGTPVLYFRDADMPQEIMVAAVPCDNAEDMANQALRILTNEKETERLARAGIDYAESFGEDYFKEMEKVYRKLL